MNGAYLIGNVHPYYYKNPKVLLDLMNMSDLNAYYKFYTNPPAMAIAHGNDGKTIEVHPNLNYVGSFGVRIKYYSYSGIQILGKKTQIARYKVKKKGS